MISVVLLLVRVLAHERKGKLVKGVLLPITLEEDRQLVVEGHEVQSGHNFFSAYPC